MKLSKQMSYNNSSVIYEIQVGCWEIRSLVDELYFLRLLFWKQTHCKRKHTEMGEQILR